MISLTKNSIAKNTLLLYFRMIIVMLVSLYTSRVVLATLGVNDYGIYNVVGSIVAMFGFMNKTLSAGSRRFLSFELGKGDFIQLQKTFFSSFVVHALLSIIIIIIAETVGLWFLNNKLNIPQDRLIAANWVFQFSVIASILSIIQVPYNATILSHERMNIFAYISIIEVILKLIIVYLLVTSEFDRLIIYSFLILLVNTFIMLIYRFYCIKQFEECKLKIHNDKEIYSSMLNFSGWNLIGTLSTTLSNQGINIIINMFFNPIANAARGIAYQVSVALSSFISNFQLATNPQITKLYAKNDYDNFKKLIFQSSKIIVSMYWALILPVYLETEFILELWLKNPPENTATFIKLILIQSILYSINSPFIIGIHATGKMKKVNLTTGFIWLLILPISYFLLLLDFPVTTPFWVNIVITPICVSIEMFILSKTVYFSFKELFIELFYPIIKILILSSILPISVYFLFEKSIYMLPILFTASICSVAISIYNFGLSKELKKKVIFTIKNIFNYK